MNDYPGILSNFCQIRDRFPFPLVLAIAGMMQKAPYLLVSPSMEKNAAGRSAKSNSLRLSGAHLRFIHPVFIQKFVFASWEALAETEFRGRVEEVVLAGRLSPASFHYAQDDLNPVPESGS